MKTTDSSPWFLGAVTFAPVAVAFTFTATGTGIVANTVAVVIDEAVACTCTVTVFAAIIPTGACLVANTVAIRVGTATFRAVCRIAFANLLSSGTIGRSVRRSTSFCRIGIQTLFGSIVPAGDEKRQRQNSHRKNYFFHDLN